MRPLPTLLTLAIAAAFGGFVATGLNAHLDNRADAAPLPAVLPTTAALPASVAGQAVPSLAPMLEKAMPAVVSVNTKQVVRVRNPFFNDPFFRRLFPDIPQERINESLGSGVIIDAKEGLVLTNHHVIENADDVQVTLADGRTVKAEFLGSDRDTDIALIRIPAQNLTDIKLGNSDQLRVGDFVVAIGNPFGFSQTVTSGIVSAVGRSGIRGLGYQNFIQTDASINPGNSGGALVDANGNLVGINTAIFSKSGGSQGIGFAIPVKLALEVMKSIVEHGQVIRGWLGIEVQPLSQELAESFGMKDRPGIVVAGIFREGPAAKAGLQLGDVILSINGEPAGDGRKSMNQVARIKPNEKITIEVMRNGQQLKLVAEVGLRPPPAPAAPQEEK